MCFEGSFFMVHSHNSTDPRRCRVDMMKLRGAVMEYEWGDHSFIPSLLNIPEDGNAKAELWMGVHPKGMNTILETGEPLSDYIDSHRSEVLGPLHESRFAHRFPFLLKVLSLNTPLSLQVHPDARLAEEGFKKESEEKRGQKSYIDPFGKDEVLFALEEVTALAGLRELDEILSTFEEILDEASDVISSCEDTRCMLTTLFNLTEPEKTLLLQKLASYLKRNPQYIDSPFLSARQIASKLLKLYPEDIMVFAPFFLNVIHLRPGEAFHVTPGMIHSYICGHAIEIMSCSDDVLRGGLTPKYVDVKEFLNVVHFEVSDGRKVRHIETSETSTILDVDSSDFSLLITESGDSSFSGREYVEIALVLEGEGIFRYEERELRVSRGDIILIPASIPCYELKLNGKLVTASVGEEVDA